MSLPEDIAAPLDLAVKSASGGEVVVTDGSNVGRIYVHRGSVAWVACSLPQLRLSDILVHQYRLARSDLDRVIEECRTTAKNFGETLLEWKLVTPEVLRRALRLHNTTHLQAICDFTLPRQTVFLPQARTYSGRLLFSVEELVTPWGHTFTQMTPPPVAVRTPALNDADRQALASIPGTLAAGTIDVRTGVVAFVSASARFDEAQQRALVGAARDSMAPPTMPQVMEWLGDKHRGMATEAIFLGDGAIVVLRCSDDRALVWFSLLAPQQVGLTLTLARAALQSCAQLRRD